MSQIEIEGEVLDSFNFAFYTETCALEPIFTAARIAEELEERLQICNKLKCGYVVAVLITELDPEENQDAENKVPCISKID